MAGSVIPKDKLTGYQRWSIGSLDATAAPHAPQAAPEDKTKTISQAIPVDEAENASTQTQLTAEDLDRIREEARAGAYQIGYQEGLAAGQQALAEATAEAATRFAELLANLQSSLANIDQHVADQILDLSLEVATQVLRGTISMRPEFLLPVIREALAALPLHHAHVTIHMNAADSAVIREQIGEQLSQTGAQIIDDPDVSPGGCRLKAGASEVDATLETRWRRVLEAIGVTPSEWMNRL